MDGVSHEPLTGDYVDIAAGQRYSVIIEANQPVDNYWITAPATVRTASSNPKCERPSMHKLTKSGTLTCCAVDPNSVFAVLHYEGAYDADPTSTPPIANGTELAEHNMGMWALFPSDERRQLTSWEVPLIPGITGSGPADQVFDIAFNVTINSNGVAFLVNGVQYQSPKLPTLLKILSGANQTSDFDPTENVVIINPGSIVEINVTGFPGHPFHLQCVMVSPLRCATIR